jgi:hypothetical protein
MGMQIGQTSSRGTVEKTTIELDDIRPFEKPAGKKLPNLPPREEIKLPEFGTIKEVNGTKQERNEKL